MRQLRGRTAVVTGASRGIGRCTSLALAELGANLVLVARDVEALEGVAAEVMRRGAVAVVLAEDLADRDAPARLLEAFETRSLQPDVLVNNAGVEGLASFVDASTMELVQVIEVNLTSALILTRLVLPGMLARRRGHVVNVSSLMGKVGAPYHVAYVATKHALVGMSQALRLECAGSGVGFSVVCPGLVRDEGMYARMNRSGARRARIMMGTVPPTQVSAAIIRAIVEERPEVLVTPRPLRPLLAAGALSPRFTERLVGLFGVTNMYERAVNGQGPHVGHGPTASATERNR